MILSFNCNSSKRWYLPLLSHPSIYAGDVFAGVGPIALAAAKKVKHVYANDLNPYAVDYLERNSVLNKLERKIEVSIVSTKQVQLFSYFLHDNFTIHC